MVAFLVLFWVFKPHLRSLSNTNLKYLAWSLKDRLQLFKIVWLSCGILYLFVNRTGSFLRDLRQVRSLSSILIVLLV